MEDIHDDDNNNHHQPVKKLLLFPVFILIIVAVVSFLVIKNNETQTNFIKGEIIVTLKKGINGEYDISLFKKYNLKLDNTDEAKSLQDIGIYKVYVPKGEERYYIDQLKQDIIVKDAGLNNKVGIN